jgi:hypothetical protein
MTTTDRGALRRLMATAAAAVLTLSAAAPATALTPSADGDDKVTGQAYVRHDGGTDTGIAHCNNTASSPAPDNNPNDADIDSNDGGSRRQGNEPYSIIDPTEPSHVFAGWNDYCLTDLGAGWQGFAYSLNGGEDWTNSIVPGYPQDTSAEGMASPLFGTHTDAGDPIAAFDSSGRLFVGGIAFNRVKPSNGDVYVATYGTTPHASGYPVDYKRTRIVGKGTPSEVIGGIFQDKPMLEVDRTGGDDDGNLYVCWSRFTGAGQNKVFFSRSTDHGKTFSHPISISRSEEIVSVQGCDIAIEADGDVYVTFRTFPANTQKRAGLGFARSTDGGASFSRARLITNATIYNPFDTDRNCGDGPVHCPSDLVFHRVPLEPRVTSDQTGQLPGVWLTYNAVKPDTIVASDPAKAMSYSSAGTGRVGQSAVYFTRTTNNGASWSTPATVEAAPLGHQFFPDIDAHAGELAVVWQDNRGPTYDVQYPIGNTRDAQGRAISAGTAIVNTFVAAWEGSAFGAALKVSNVAHQSQYEMFGARDLPFHGDYNWISLAEVGDDVIGYMTWTDNRDVVPGADPRELQAQNGFNDGFDVDQCLIDLNPPPGGATIPGIPLARSDAPFTGNNCGNSGGVDQNIYGNSVTFD